MPCSDYLSSRTQRIVSSVFRKIGYNAYAHPCKFILFGIILTILSSLGLLLIKFESKGVRLWVPTDAEIMSNYNEVIDNFGEFETSCILLVSNKNNDNILESDNLDALFDQFEYISNDLTFNYKSKSWYYDDLCLRDYPSYPICEADENNIFALFGNTQTNWQSQESIDTAISTNAGQALAEFLLGDLVYDEDDTELIINGKYMRIIWGLSSTTNNTIFSANEQFMTEFQDYFDYNNYKSNEFDELGFEYSYFTSRSFSDEAGRVVSEDTAIYIATFGTMFVYLAFTLGKFTCVGARSWLAVITMVCMIMALLSGYGLGCLIGLDMNSVVLLIPYLLIGVGVDDEILIIEAIDRTPYPNNDSSKGAERFSHALEHCGLSISLTTFCSIIAFVVGTNVTMPGVAAFCGFAAFCFWSNYVLQFLIFLPLFALDEQRKNANRNFCCWFIVHDYSDNTNTTNDNNNTDENDQDDNKFKQILKHVNVMGLMDYIVIPSLSKRLYRLLFIILFTSSFIVSIISLQWLNVESDTSRLVPDDSFAINYLNDINDAFGSSTLTTLDIVLKNIDFSDKTSRDNIQSLITEIESYDKKDSFSIGSVDNWLFPFNDFINETSNGTLSINDIADKDQFYQLLQSFANSTEYIEWANEIIYGYDNDEDELNNLPSFIKATRFYIDFSLPQSLRDQWPLREDLKKVVENNVGNNKGYVFVRNWPFAYFEFSIVGLTVRNIGSASAGVLLTLIFMMDIKMAIFIIIIVIMIDIELFGWMVLCNVSLDSITFLQLVMAVGLTVDYVIHITHALTDAHVNTESSDYDFRQNISIAMKEMGVGVVKGAWTTFLGIFSLSFSSSVAFRGFFTVFAGIILVAVTNGLFFVPSLMSELPFLYKNDHDDNDNENNGNDLEKHHENHNNGETDDNETVVTKTEGTSTAVPSNLSKPSIEVFQVSETNEE